MNHPKPNEQDPQPARGYKRNCNDYAGDESELNNMLEKLEKLKVVASVARPKTPPLTVVASPKTPPNKRRRKIGGNKSKRGNKPKLKTKKRFRK
jgi:hypothetical protein